MPYIPIDNFRDNIEFDRSSYPVRDSLSEKGTWNNPLEIGDYFVWKNNVDNQLYKKNSAPINDNDGTIINLTV